MMADHKPETDRPTNDRTEADGPETDGAAMTALLIDVKARAVRRVTYRTLDDMYAMVGGGIEMAFQWPNGDTLYVDGEGLFKYSDYFRIGVRPDQPLAGNGLLVGAETGIGLNTAPPTMTLAALVKQVRFLGD
jgi:hypothetical protein